MEALKEFWNLFLDWPQGTIISVISIIVAIVPSALIGYLALGGILSAFNSWFMPDIKSLGEVMDKKVRPRIREMAGAIDIPAGWLVTVKAGEETGDISVSKTFFDSLNKGDKVNLLYKNGRIYKGLKIKEIEII